MRVEGARDLPSCPDWERSVIIEWNRYLIGKKGTASGRKAEPGGDILLRKILSICSLFVFVPLLIVMMIPINAQSDPADPEDVAHMKSGHKKVEGVVIDMKSGLYTVKTSTGATLTLTENAAVRHGHGIPQVGDEMTLWVNEGNLVMDAHKKGHSDQHHQFISGTLASINNAKSQLTLSTSGGEKNYKVKPESRMFKDIAPGAQVTIEVNETGEVIDLHKDKK